MAYKKKKRRTPTIAIVYHNVREDPSLSGLPEHRITDADTSATVRTVRRVLKTIGCATQLIKVVGKDLSPLKKIKADYIFNLTDSRQMEMRMALILDRLRIPYSGSPSQAILNSNNKVRTKGLFQKHKIPTPEFTPLSLSTKITRGILPSKFPIIVKPAYEHCSVGITDQSVVTTFKQLKSAVKSLRQKVRQMLILEQYVRGKEIHIVVLERGNETVALPPAEMRFRGRIRSKWNIYGFTEKWNTRSKVYKNLYFQAPTKGVPENILRPMQRDAIRAFYLMGFRDYARFDLRYHPKTRRYYILEGNANPGLSTNPDDALIASLLAADMTFEDFIRTIIRSTLSMPLPRRRRRA